MANASCEAEGGGCLKDEIMVGRFVNLPDQVVHHIVSFLAITDLTRFGCVSKKCRELYLTSPSLKFDEFSLANTSSCYKRMNLLRSLDKFLIHRGENKIHQFCIRWVPPENFDHETPCFCGCNEKSGMMAWIHYAVRCKVEVLDLEISIFEKAMPLAFPFFILQCKSLRSVSLDMNCMIHTPSFTVFSSLKCLELKNVRILNESFFKWISNSCKCIEELDLDDVHGIRNINIESPSLKSFKFGSCNQTRFCHLKISGEKLISIFVYWSFYSSLNKSFSLSAPNLERFYWFGNLLDHSNLGETGLYKRGIIPPLFRNTCYLCMHIGSFVNDLVPWMVFLFRRMPNLCTLYIKSTPPLSDCNSHHTCGFYMEYWKQQNFGFILELNEVTIELSRGLNGIEIARYMLEHAQNLKKMVIVCLPQQSGFVKRMLDKSKMISNGTVVFKENRQERKLV
ncbi:putative F-box domain, leucine-rich repeat domain, L domain-containing protein [Rosa chinensis]|uniref:Putative F-box domain, leucine-rich repeat domain, L domain-containing protein n=1 Tax=Rosa chinensis TaxID=74649 RepID=A0A2P6RC20_ROSCH|nr:putative F-box domain, leucine-rich repeat domain, L domain-containing protein [Rosa chinensis]